MENFLGSMMSDKVLSRGFVSLIYVFDEEEHCNSSYTVITGMQHVMFRCRELTYVC
jgi:hypothetical protein